MIAEQKGVEDIGLTTNGILLEEYAFKLKNAGLKRVNISLDTLSPTEYAYVTRGGDIRKVFAGIKAAKQSKLNPIKINAVTFNPEAHQKQKELTEFAERNGLSIRFIRKMDLDSGVFSVVEGGTGGICEICNRLRLTADGLIKPCLFSDIGFSVRELGAEEAIKRAVLSKPEKGMVCYNHKFYNIGG